MSEPTFRHVEELFHLAVEVSPDERASFLDAACGGDSALRAAVQELLNHDAADDGLAMSVSPVTRPSGAADAPTRPAATGAPGPLPALPGYDVLQEIGRGGMGVVYKARQLSLDRLVALKMLLPATPGDLEPLARFRTEAEVLARLHHPNIVPIYGIGEHEARPYFTMEYVPGPNLARFMDARPQDPAASARLVETLARAVHAAHQCGVVHRDLKPANILLTLPADGDGRGRLTAGEPRITDFGLAKDTATPRDLTQTGDALGTPRYMAPEQARGDRTHVGPRTDVYALGTILYEMLTGRPPFDAETPAETIRQVVDQDPPSPSRLRPRLPRDLVTVCMKCLEKAPRRRYATALELAEDLHRFHAGEPIRARPAGVAERTYRWCARRPLAAALLALAGALTAGLIITVIVYEMLLNVAAQRQLDAERKLAEERERQVIRLDLTIGLMDQDAGDACTALLYFTEALRLEDDLRGHDPEPRARVAALLRRCPRPVRLVTFDEPVVCARLSPSGGWAAVAGGDRVVEVRDLPSGRPAGMPLGIGAAPLDGAFSADGARLVVIDAVGSVRVWDVKSRGLLAGPVRLGRPALRVAFTADGERLVFTGTDGTAEVYMARTGERIESSPPEEGPDPATISPDGRLRVGVTDGAACVWETTTGRAVIPPLHQGGPVKAAAFTADGKDIVVVSGAGVVCTWRLPPGPEAAPDRDEDRPTAELVALAQLLASARIDEHEDRQPLDTAGMKAAWEKMSHEP